jgi:hypothetical protein
MEMIRGYKSDLSSGGGCGAIVCVTWVTEYVDDDEGDEDSSSSSPSH